MKIGIDVMGGDFAPNIVLEGVKLALNEIKDVTFVLYGDENTIKKYFTNLDRIEIRHTTEYLSMGEKDPVSAIRRNKNTTLAYALREVSEKLTDAVVTAGPTQAVIVGAHFYVKRIENMKRTAIATFIPSLDGKGKFLLDVGANIELKPEHIVDLAYAATVNLKYGYNIDKPLVGLLNIGTEESKGREVDKESYKLLSEDSRINFYGNVEPKEIFSTEANILVTDGFTGNMVMKTMEGVAAGMKVMLSEEIKKSFSSKIGYLFMKKSFRNYKKRLDPKEIGGAMILGVNAPIIKAHGSSDGYAFMNAIKQAINVTKNNTINVIKENLK